MNKPKYASVLDFMCFELCENLINFFSLNELDNGFILLINASLHYFLSSCLKGKCCFFDANKIAYNDF